MARRRTQTQSSKIRGPRRKKAGLPKEILSERYVGDDFEAFTPVGQATFRLLNGSATNLIALNEPNRDRAGHLETKIEAPIGGPLTLVSVAVRVKGRKAKVKDSASEVEVAVEADGISSEWQRIALSDTLGEGEAIFAFTGEKRFESSSVKLRPSTDGRVVVLEWVEVKALGRTF